MVFLETWQVILYVLNGLIIAASLAMIALGVESILALDITKIVIPTWLSWSLIVVGSFMLIMSILGIIGARSSRYNAKNCPIILYLFFLFIVFIAQLALFIVIFVSMGLFANPAPDLISQELIDNGVKAIFTEIPDAWIEVQTEGNCCGFRKLDDELATGPSCPANSVAEMSLDVNATFQKLLTSPEESAVAGAYCDAVALTFNVTASLMNCTAEAVGTTPPLLYTFVALWDKSTYSSSVSHSHIRTIMNTFMSNSNVTTANNNVALQVGDFGNWTFVRLTADGSVVSKDSVVETSSPTKQRTAAPTSSQTTPSTSAPTSSQTTPSTSAPTSTASTSPTSTAATNTSAPTSTATNNTSAPTSTAATSGRRLRRLLSQPRPVGLNTFSAHQRSLLANSLAPEPGTCYQTLLTLLQSDIVISGCILGGAVLFQLIAMVSASCLCCCNPQSKSDRSQRLDEFEMERTRGGRDKKGKYERSVDWD